ncbi:MAG TPA: tetratricopeptide repeat protein, partial [Urbifossiella sp.]
YMLDQKETARQALEDVLAKHPDYGMALRTMGQFALTDGRRAEAELWLRRAAAALPGDYQAQFQLAEALRILGKPEAAAQMKIAEQVRDRSERLGELQSRKLAEQPLDPALHVEMATLLMQSGQTEVAVRWLESALALDPKFRPAHAALAEYHAKRGEPEAAEHQRTRAAE